MRRKKVFLSLIVSFFFVFLLLLPVNKVMAIKEVWVEVDPNVCSEAATYKIHFQLEKTLQVHNWIKIIFPYDTEFPSEFPETKPGPCSQKLIVDYEERSLKFCSKLELDPSIPGYENIVVSIPKDVGIKNPSMPGEYTILICTGEEPEPVESKTYSIGEFDSEEIKISVLNGKMGKDEYYLEPPQIEIEPTNGKEAQIYYRCDILNNEFLPYEGSFKLPEGQYITRITAYMELLGEVIGIRSKVVKVDSLKPVIRMQEPKEETTITTRRYFLLKGFTKAQVFHTFGKESRVINRYLTIEDMNSQKLINIKTDFKGHFNYELKLEYGENIITVSCEDKVGNKTTNKYIIIRK